MSSHPPAWTILPAGHGRAISLRRGQSLRIVNLHGTQVVDLWALSAAEPLEYAAMEHTRSRNSSVFVERGMSVYSNRRNPMLTMVADSSPGRHDTQLCPCSAELYRELTPDPHRSCTQNLHEALAAVGLALPFAPASLNLFMNVPIAQDGGVRRLPPASRAGDAVTLRAEMDVTVIMSACPQDITPINGADHTPRDIGFAILDARPPGPQPTGKRDD
ncbi:urea carboxylase-associated family protein [Paracoccus aminovorans]|uniref:urea carboxylase-associated family protein n=1 Tax=Paracoccus aminovorans TaxID=34004 RepID=UPI002B258A4B|nr:urea carboxylase-associated family protein [Paracoccus aminovorans]